MKAKDKTPTTPATCYLLLEKFPLLLKTQIKTLSVQVSRRQTDVIVAIVQDWLNEHSENTVEVLKQKV